MVRMARTLGPFVSFPDPVLSLRLALSPRVATSAPSVERFLPKADHGETNKAPKREGRTTSHDIALLGLFL